MRYLYTISELKENALAELGLMTDGTYADFMAQAQQYTAHPKLMLGLIYNDLRMNLGGGMKETPYAVIPEEWDIFISEIPVYLDSVPLVYVVDGTQFTAPI